MPKARKWDGVYRRPDSPFWWCSYTDASGKRARRKLAGAHTRTQALEMLGAIRTQEDKARILGVRPATAITLSDLFDRYKKHQKARIRPTTFARLGGILDTLKANLPEQAKAITKRTIAEYIDKRAEIREARNSLQGNERAQALPQAGRGMGRVESEPGGWCATAQTPAGQDALSHSGRIESGSRIGSRMDARADGLCRLHGSPARGNALAPLDGCGHEESAALSAGDEKRSAANPAAFRSAALQVLGSLPSGAAGDPVFAGVDAANLSVYTKRVFTRLGILDASFHTLRHTAASWLVQQGVDLYAVGQILGHKTPRMTQRYAHLSPDYMAGAVGKLDGIMGGMLPAPRGPVAQRGEEQAA